jgi:hypothetical protein
MSINNVSFNNSIQYNPYVASRDVNSADVEANKRSAQTDNASINEYGDEFVRSSITRTEDGAVFAKPVISDDVTARVPEEEELPKIDSLIGYTTSQVQQFYYEGRISRYDYDVKMEQREELLASEEVDNDSDEDQRAVNTTDNAEDVGVNELTASEKNKVEVTKDSNDKAVEDERQTKATNEKAYKDNKEAKSEIVSDANKDAEALNKKMSVIGNEQRDNEEFEIIESGNDPAATFKLVQNLNDLGSGVVEGGTWNIA